MLRFEKVVWDPWFCWQKKRRGGEGGEEEREQLDCQTILCLDYSCFSCGAMIMRGRSSRAKEKKMCGIERIRVAGWTLRKKKNIVQKKNES